MTLLVSACATLPPVVPGSADCRANYLGIDQRVDRADARDGGAHRIPGFPYARSDRFLASFRDEVSDGPAFDAWVGRLRQLDLQARAAELRNLGWDDPSEELRHLDQCGREWAARDLADPARRALLREQAAVPDDYSMLRRTLGVYPVAAIFLDMGIRDFNAQVLADYAKSHAVLDSPGPLVLWTPSEPPGGAATVGMSPVGAATVGVGAATAGMSPVGAATVGEGAATVGEGAATVGMTPVGAAHGRDSFARKDALGIPLLGDGHWQSLARAHAPRWLIETGGDFDLIGAPRLDEQPTVDATRPTTYFHPAYTRFGDRVLAQLVYTIWFSARPKAGFMDPYGGALDGIVWRVTLDEQGEPLLYDTIHACGCYHYYYVPAPAGGSETLRRKPLVDSTWQEPVLFPQSAPAAPFAIRVQSLTHYVRRLVPLGELDSVGAAHGRDERSYTLTGYDELRSLPAGESGRRSLFREDGIADGTERLERFFLWPAGIESAGAMRQWGRHATSFVGRSHFDDPRMLDRLFEAR